MCMSRLRHVSQPTVLHPLNLGKLRRVYIEMMNASKCAFYTGFTVISFFYYLVYLSYVSVSVSLSLPHHIYTHAYYFLSFLSQFGIYTYCSYWYGSFFLLWHLNHTRQLMVQCRCCRAPTVNTPVLIAKLAFFILFCKVQILKTFSTFVPNE